MKTERCFLITTNSRDCGNHFEIELFAKNDSGSIVHIIVDDYRPLFFVSHHLPTNFSKTAVERRCLTLETFDNHPVDCLYFKTITEMLQCASFLRSEKYPVFESDIHPVDRFLMERNVYGSFEATGVQQQTSTTIFMKNPHIRGTSMNPDFAVLSLDIETNAQTGSIYSIAFSGNTNRVFIWGKGASTKTIVICRNEKEVLQKSLDAIYAEDPDIIIGWNVINFDLSIIAERCAVHGIRFSLGRGDRLTADYTGSARNGSRKIVRIRGRAVIDVPHQLRTYQQNMEEYSLNHVASVLLGKTKEIALSGVEKIAEINRRFSEDTMALAQYNLEDAILTREIFEITHLLPDAIERSRLSGHLLDRTGGSIAAFDYVYLPRLHRAGYIAPDTPAAVDSDIALPGGFVIEPKPGIYENVLVFDFRSLYPSIILTFMIDPLGAHLNDSKKRTIVPSGLSFASEPAILPGIIRELLSAREEAKKKENHCLSHAIKILMNSFYGVLGARNCRFFSSELASAITQTGRYILKKSIEYMESSRSLHVIYGDTDSLFICLGKNGDKGEQLTGTAIADDVTKWLANDLKATFDVDSALLLQFETHFRHFLIPSVRGTSQGSKKHYCGITYENGAPVLHFKGMESARSDWTDLAKEFQQELIRRIFCNEPLDSYIFSVLSDLREGRLDGKLIYKKHLKKNIAEYTQSIPPHVQAAKMLKNPPHRISYYITIDGPQPLEMVSSPLNYDHYIDCQLQPVADSILELIGKNFSPLISGQQDLFR